MINLAIETSGRRGEIALGRDDELLAVRELPQKRRHNIDLMQTVDELFGEHGVRPGDLGEIYISSGPGSFTGLRIGMTAAKMLSMSGKVRLVSVPTLEATAFAPEWRPSFAGGEIDDAWGYFANGCVSQGEGQERLIGAGLNVKRGTMYCAVYRWGASRLRAGHGRLEMVVEPGLRSGEELAEQVMLACGKPGRLLPGGTMICEVMPDDLASAVHGQIKEGLMGKVAKLAENKHLQVVTGADASPRAESVWVLGRELAKAGRYSDPRTLNPAYVREPEAVTLWNERHGEDGPRK